MDSAGRGLTAALKVAAANPAARLKRIPVPPQCWNRSEVKLPAGVVALAWHPWQSGRPTSTPTSSSQPPAAASASLPSSPAAPPPPQCPELPTLHPPGRRSLRHWRSTHADNRPTGIERHLQVRSPNLRAVTNHRQRPLAQAFYSCYPSVAAADVCWPSPPTSMLCMNNPWDKEVRRLGLDTCLLPTVQPPATPEPFALTLDNGTHCRLITGGIRRARSDGYVSFYACRADSTPSVLGEAGSETDRSTAQDPCGW